MFGQNCDGEKTFFEGTHRVLGPAATLANVMPLVSRMGITRVAVLTGLDVVGIPVAAATRPNSASIAVHQGKGMTLDAAKASAVMEAIECFHGENITLPLRRLSHSALSLTEEAASPEMLPRSRGRVYAGESLLWIEGRDIMSGRSLWLPYELVTVDYTDPLPAAAGYFHATTNGLAAGNHWLEATLHALYEIIERDAVALWHAQSETAQDESGLDASLIETPLARSLLALFERAGVGVRIWDVTSDIGVPAFACMAASPHKLDAVEPEFGFGCHADRDVALARALTEAAQARLTRISGGRDDYDVASYAPGERQARQEAAARWMRADARGGFRARATSVGRTLRHDLDTVLAKLAAVGVAQVGCVDLSRSEFGVSVVRVVVPGLEGPWTPSNGDYTPGHRARAIMA